MRSALGSLAKSFRKAIPLWAYPYWIRRDVVGVFYHSVSDERLPHVQQLYPPEPVERFEAALRYIKQHYQPISDAELAAARLKGRALPKKALHLSFDDGFAECYSMARPLLLQYGIPCTFFVTTGWLDNQTMFYRNKVSLCLERMVELPQDAAKMVYTSLNNALDIKLANAADFRAWIMKLPASDEPVIDMAARMLGLDIEDYLATRQPYLTRQQVKQMQADGFTIGAHTVKHIKLSALSPEQAEAEMLTSATEVQALTGAEQVPFSFPYSATGLDRDWLAGVRQRNPQLGLLYDTMDMRLDRKFMVNRIWAEKAGYRNAGRSTNLPALLHAAYRAEAYDAMHGRGGEPNGEEPG